MKLALIPSGSFLMGAESGDPNERPVRRVRITRPFCIGVHEVTQREYEAVTGNRAPGFKGDDFPVGSVTWEDARAFCAKLSQLEKQKYRLPTEAEWEYACRAGTRTAWSFGDRQDEVVQYAWTQETSPDNPQPVGQKKPNPFGLYDMHGNVWEFCSDWYGPFLVQAEYDPQGPGAGRFRVFRGGSHYFPSWESRSSNRPDRQFPPRGGNLGFRVVREAEEPLLDPPNPEQPRTKP
jgi:formylglycine-generating enzyme required for sulfatase activity